MSHDEEMRNKRVDIQPSMILHQEKPFVYILSSKFRTEHCDFCFQRGNSKLSKCSGCRYVYYCDKVCQKDGWDVHKFECRNLNKIAPRIVPDAARLLARLIKILQKGGDKVQSYYTETSFRMYKDLMSHYPNLKKDQHRMEHLSSLYGVLVEFLGNEMIPNSAELMGMYGRMCVNSFNICNQEMQSLGTGIYLGASIVDHSCKPNALATFEGTTLYIRALEEIPLLDWTKIFICYIDVLNCTKNRQEELQKTYYFLCQCSKCLEPEPLGEMNGAACPNLQCDNFIDINSIKAGEKCLKCGTIVTEHFLNEFNEVMEFTCGHLERMKHITYLDVCKVCLKKHKNLLYKYNLKHVKVLDLAFESCIEFGQFNDALNYGLELVDCFYKYYGKLHPLTGLLHLKLAKILMYQNNVSDAVQHVKISNEILKITHGTNSSLYRNEVFPLLYQCTSNV